MFRLQKIALATSSLSHGAHSLPSRHDNAHAVFNERLDRTSKVIRWFLRLHLALFYWNGMYPSVLHRLTGGTIVSDGMPAIVANRPTYKPVAAIVLFQAGTALARVTAEASIEVAHFIQIAWFRWRRSRRRQTEQWQNSGGRRHQYAANTERAEYMDLIEEHVPGIGSVDNNNTFKLHATTRKKDNKQQTTGLTNHGLASCCGICLNERVHPSAPSVCGHVFCWSCILHWVSNVRAECPLCRAATRRQDIIPLYNYP
jgi:peroxin-10